MYRSNQHSAKSIFETFSHLEDYAHYGRLKFQKPSVFCVKEEEMKDWNSLFIKKNL